MATVQTVKSGSKWIQRPLGSFFTRNISGEWGLEPATEDSPLVVGTIDFNNDGTISWDSVKCRNITTAKLRPRLLFEGNILIEKSGGSDDQPAGRVVYCDRTVFGTCSNFVQLLTVDAKLQSRFMFYLLYHCYTKGLVYPFQQKTTGIINFKIGEYFRTRVSIPESPVEQASIAAILLTVDEAIERTEKLIWKLSRIKQGLMQDLLTRGIDNKGNIRSEKTHKFKNSPLGLIPEEWTLCPLSTLAEVDRGKFAHRPRNDPRFYGGQHPFIQTGDVSSAEGRVVSTFSQTLNDRGAAVSREFPTNTIAITIAANIADTAILGRPMFFPDSVVGAVVKAPHSNRYVELCIRRAKRLLNARAPQSAQKNINLEDLRPLLIPVPSADEEFRIAEVYEGHETRIMAEEMLRGKLQALKRGLMQDLLSGKVRVTHLLTQ